MTKSVAETQHFPTLYPFLQMATIFAINRCSSSVYQRFIVQFNSTQRFNSLSSRISKSRFIKLNNLRRNCSLSSNAAAPFIVADDEKYGNKQIISITPRLYDYILANVREPPVLKEIPLFSFSF